MIGLGALVVSLQVPVEDRRVAETFQRHACDLAAILSRLSGSATNGSQYFSPSNEPYRNFALDMA
jgi:hypothetical protein